MAAIVADVLEEEEYDVVSHMLDHDVNMVVKWIKTRGLESRTYWVCPFSVNQHAGICGSNPHQHRDSITGELYPICACGLPKAFNDTAPLMPDARGIGCEMNKFRDMMEYLSATDPNFEQIVAIDDKFQLFFRAWCVSEIATSEAAGMRQQLKIRSATGFAAHEKQLRTLRIVDMEATRPEDKAEILSDIPDTVAFDTHLQQLLFEDLFPAWFSFDAIEQMHRIARIARWYSARPPQGCRTVGKLTGSV